MQTNTLTPRLTRCKRVTVAACALLATAAAILAIAAQAQATQLNQSFYTHVETTAAEPNVAPNYVAGSPVIPDGPGHLGNPFALTLSNGQALGVQNGSTASGTPVVAENRTGKANEAWRLYRVGWVATWPECVDQCGNSNIVPPTVNGHPAGYGRPVFKIINYSASGSHTCLTAAGDDPVNGAAVTSDSCDPTTVNQTNQLWMVGSNGSPESGILVDLVDMTTGVLQAGQGLFTLDTNSIADQGNDSQYTLTSVASLLADQGYPAQALILSSGYRFNGDNSPSIVGTPADATTSNSLYGLTPMVPPAAAPPGQDCVAYACLFGGL